MSVFKCPIPGHENDNVLVFKRRHPVAFLKTIFMIILMLLIPVAIGYALKANNQTYLPGIVLNFLVIATSVYYLIVFNFAFAQWVSYYYNVFILTDEEVLDVKQEGLFDNRVTEISILRIQDVSARIHGFWSTFFNYGDVVAESAGENSHTYIIDNIPDPITVANLILNIHNQHIEKEERADEMIVGVGDLRGGKLKESKLSCPPCPPCEVEKNEGNISKDDLESGGEIKL